MASGTSSNSNIIVEISDELSVRIGKTEYENETKLEVSSFLLYYRFLIYNIWFY